MKKYVLTGGPASGKTSVINELKKRGFSVIDEVARKVIDERKHLMINETEKIIRQEIIFQRQLDIEKEFENINLLFLDRGVIDNLAYCYHLLENVPKSISSFNFSNRYDGIFVLDRLPFEQDGLRVEKDDEEADKMHRTIINTYKKNGYELTFVPIIPIKERADFILNNLDELKGGIK